MANAFDPAHAPRLFCVPATDEGGDVLPPAPDGAPPGPWTKETAYRYCERMATSHYENFPVASRFVPAPLRPHVWAIYAFARTADDFADEPRFEGRRREALDRWEQYLEVCYHRDVDHPVFLALRDTVRRHSIPIGPLKALLTAFRMDLTKLRYANSASCASTAPTRPIRSGSWCSTSTAIASPSSTASPTRSARPCRSPTSCRT